jgi:V/A-type H+/Na+-transporting ATPase subunit I
MALDPVVKVELTAHTAVLDEILKDLQSSSLIHVDPHSIRQWESEQADIEATRKRTAELKREAQDVVKALNFIRLHEPKVPFLKKFSMQPDAVTREGLRETAENKSAAALKAKCLHLEQQLADLRVKAREAVQRKEDLLPIAGFGAPLSLLTSGEKTRVFISKLEREPYSKLEKVDVPELIAVERIGGENTVYFSVHYHEEAQEYVDRFERDFHFEPLSFESTDESPLEVIEGCERTLGELAVRKEALLGEAQDLVKEAFVLRHYYDHLMNEIEKEVVKERCFFTEKTSVLHGWIKKRDRERVSATVGAHREAHVAEIEKEEEELAPTVLRNNAVVSPFETIVNIFSTPHQKDVDPTPFVAPFYSLFFAICLTEGGYGVVITLLCALALWLLKPRGPMRRFINLFLVLGVVSIVIGVLIGTIFGINFDALPQNLAWLREARYKVMIFDSGKEVMTFFAMCLGIGILHLITGYVIKMYMAFRDGDWMSAVCDNLPYIFLLLAPVPKLLARSMPDRAQTLNYAFFALLGLWGLTILFFSERGTWNPIKRIGKGLFTLYGVSSVFGDVLSYSRLLALGIATGVIAGVVNILADLVKQLPVVGIVVFVPVLIFGHLFNLATSGLSAFVHSIRLNFMEFFSRFYIGDGRMFTPFSEKRKYTLVKAQK